MSNVSNPSASRYLSLDVLRGLAALSIVVYHWPHFFFSGVRRALELPPPNLLPFYKLMRPVYENGFMAVDLFFSLSGFIFFCFYAKQVSENRVSGRSFAWLRFSRLYPLHFFTLLLVALLQWGYFNRYGVYFVYQVNDLQHFALQLFFASNWYPDDVLSFNGPVWSVSIEILLYAAFFFVCRYGSIRPLFLLCLTLVGMLLSLRFDYIGRGLFAFFLGGLCFQAAMWIQQGGERYEKAMKYGVAMVVVLSFLLLGSNLLSALAVAGIEVASTLRNKVIETAKLEQFFVGWYLRGVLFPASILLLALMENDLKRVTQPISWIGDITYASYLLHFPLQLCWVMFLSYANVQVDFLSVTIFLTYFGLVIGFSFASFHWFEKPVQLWLRHRGLAYTRPKAAA